MSDENSLDEIIETLIIREKIKKGIKDIEEGRYYSHEEAKKILEEWLK
jgi:predicted transcriptional regulator